MVSPTEVTTSDPSRPFKPEDLVVMCSSAATKKRPAPTEYPIPKKFKYSQHAETKKERLIEERCTLTKVTKPNPSIGFYTIFCIQYIPI